MYLRSNESSTNLLSKSFVPQWPIPNRTSAAEFPILIPIPIPTLEPSSSPLSKAKLHSNYHWRRYIQKHYSFENSSHFIDCLPVEAFPPSCDKFFLYRCGDCGCRRKLVKLCLAEVENAMRFSFKI
ncbi:predicted protein [Sclerotinia sclerotiorum 1980 UF-70]|uniref:Uncharacterized protein n=1 Tax=Sclerotinia sclerotiorum (strain ATCC 18683 / 1980 / Ss-1) TaxID=665079 RepID=A7E507_SCLS1|nr:predicted protein [Sclerotinia sclerotiorum 1980 UF-70]EDN90979.1 predicted protein [Sclerotinia sclerotiorum 1980 UF-70]